uniref:Uncharacterized protein n=1 Tax=Romanomermis culicivorax TaxID=13658 RepID=A0A915JX30_ROMCU
MDEGVSAYEMTATVRVNLAGSNYRDHCIIRIYLQQVINLKISYQLTIEITATFGFSTMI